MGRLRLIPLMMSLLLLAGCGGRQDGKTGEDLALQIQADWRDVTALTCRLDLSADYGQRVFDCAVDVTYDSLTGGTVTVTQPDLAAGITARFQGEDLALEYDGVSLETGPLTDQGISPLEGPVTWYRQLTEGYVASWDLTEDALTLTVRDYDGQPGVGLESVFTFDAQTLTPQAAELLWDGSRVLSAQVSNFQMMTGETADGSAGS